MSSKDDFADESNKEPADNLNALDTILAINRKL